MVSAFYKSYPFSAVSTIDQGNSECHEHSRSKGLNL